MFYGLLFTRLYNYYKTVDIILHTKYNRAHIFVRQLINKKLYKECQGDTINNVKFYKYFMKSLQIGRQESPEYNAFTLFAFKEAKSRLSFKGVSRNFKEISIDTRRSSSSRQIHQM